MMLLKQQNWEQWQGAGISAGNWGVCQEAFSPAGGPSDPTPHLSYKHTQIAPPLLQPSLWPNLSEYLAIPRFHQALTSLSPRVLLQNPWALASVR